jgi:hypothetical protein
MNKKEVTVESKISLQDISWIPDWQRPLADRKGFFGVQLWRDDDRGRRLATVELLAHPYLANRIFTRPLVDEVSISCGKIEGQTIVRNTTGVTVHDVYVAPTEQ